MVRLVLLLCLLASIALRGEEQGPADPAAAGPLPLAPEEGHAPWADLGRLLDRHRIAGRTLFRMLDRDGDSYLDAAEAEPLLGPWAAPFLAAADRDGDGRVQASEARRIARDAPGRYAFATRVRDDAPPELLAAAAGDGGGRYRAWAFFGQQHAFIGDYDVAGNGTYDPVISVINSGDFIGLTELVVYEVPVRRRP